MNVKYIEGQERRQQQLFCESIEELISQDNPVRILDAFVDSLDLVMLGIDKPCPASMGRPGYDPRILLKLYLYGYFNKIRSSRKLMIEATRNVELFFLINRLTPDFRTIADFRKNNAVALHHMFLTFSQVCLELGLYKKTLAAIDGSKFRAQNSKKNAYNQKTLREKLERIDKNIQSYLEVMDSNDAAETDQPSFTETEIQNKLEQLKQRQEKYQGLLQELAETKETQILTTDPEARVMQSKDGYHCCYNVQTVTDESHLIVDYAVTNHGTDQGLLKQMADQARQVLKVPTLDVIADRGYESRQDIENCFLDGIIPNVVMKYDRSQRVYNLEYQKAEITETLRHSTDPQDIRTCLHAGVLPACYEQSSLKVEIQTRQQLSCFTKNSDESVTCPMGRKLAKVRGRRGSTIYRSNEACRECLNRCTSSRQAKEVSFGPNTQYVPVLMYGSTHHPVNAIPEGIDPHPYNHSLDRKNFVDQKVVVTLSADESKMKKRMSLVEHPFGTIKWYHGAHYVLCRGIKKATAEIGMSMLVYNLRRAIKLAGFERLLEYLQTRKGMLAVTR